MGGSDYVLVGALLMIASGLIAFLAHKFFQLHQDQESKKSEKCLQPSCVLKSIDPTSRRQWIFYFQIPKS